LAKIVEIVVQQGYIKSSHKEYGFTRGEGIFRGAIS
jgi:hypothetical protein